MELSDEDEEKLIEDYSKSKNRLILLDYDGTLTPFFDEPEEARPDDELLEFLEKLVGDPKNEVVLVSGRDKYTLEKWFDMDVGCVSGHGVRIKEKGKEWREIESLRSDWKGVIRPILETHVDKTPGSFIEEKDFSIAWHYRKVDPELGSVRAEELIDALKITDSLNLHVLEGNKVIEVIDADISKGRAVLHWIEKKDWDFILAIGDDLEDEDIFGVLPETGYSIKVGPGPTQARFRLDSPPDVLSLLNKLAET